MFGIARRAWMITMVCGMLGISLASVASLGNGLSLGSVSLGGLDLGEKVRGAFSGILPRPSESVRVQYVIDGDTFVAKIDGERQKVRLIGADTPESVKRGVPVQCYAKKASHYSKDHLTGKQVKLIFDVDRKDKYGRTLAYVELGGKDYSKTLLKKGLARPLTIPPNVARSVSYEAAAGNARKADRGLWGACEG